MIYFAHGNEAHGAEQSIGNSQAWPLLAVIVLTGLVIAGMVYAKRHGRRIKPREPDEDTSAK